MLYTIHYILYTIYYILYTIYYILYTICVCIYIYIYMHIHTYTHPTCLRPCAISSCLPPYLPAACLRNETAAKQQRKSSETAAKQQRNLPACLPTYLPTHALREGRAEAWHHTTPCPPNPHIPYPIPYTLYPTPYTLYPIPYPPHDPLSRPRPARRRCRHPEEEANALGAPARRR